VGSRCHPLLLGLWAAALALAAAAPVQEGGVDGAVSLVDIGAGLEARAGGDDGCSKAYDKFKADVAKVTSLKEKSDAKLQKLEKEKKTSDEGLQRCNEDHKEINAKATFKKENNERTIKSSIKEEIASAKAKMEAKLKEDKRTLIANAKRSEKKAQQSEKEKSKWRAKYSQTKRDLRSKFKKKLSESKKDSKSEMKRTLKLELQAGIMKNSQEVTKVLTAKCEKKLSNAATDAAEVLNRVEKKSNFAMTNLKEDHRKALEKATESMPPTMESELTTTKDQLKVAIEARAKAESDKTKSDAKAKEAKAEQIETISKSTLKLEDCETRERRLQGEQSTAAEQAKVLRVKLDASDSKLSEKTRDIEKLKREIKELQETIKGKDEVFAATDEKRKTAAADLMKCRNKYKMTMAKLSSGEGALMAEIETLKSAADKDATTVQELKRQAGKVSLDLLAADREKNAASIKYREAAQELHAAKQDSEKYKVKFDTLETAHSTVTERYRNANSKLELCSDRTRDSNIKFQGCEEAMRRMKTYNADQQNEQKLEVGRLRTELETAKSDAAKLQVSQEEKAQSAAMAKEATAKAVADAVEQAQAKGLAVTANAQAAVDKAAKEAVALAREQANAGNAV